MMSTADDSLLLIRTGKPPLRLPAEREEILRLSTRHERTRQWYNVGVWKVGAKYVLSIEFASDLKHEPGHHDVWPLNSIEFVGATLAEYDPLAHVIGFQPRSDKTRSGKPNEENTAHKQAQLRQRLTQEWQALLSQSYADLGIVETL